MGFSCKALRAIILVFLCSISVNAKVENSKKLPEIFRSDVTINIEGQPRGNPFAVITEEEIPEGADRDFFKKTKLLFSKRGKLDDIDTVEMIEIESRVTEQKIDRDIINPRCRYMMGPPIKSSLSVQGIIDDDSALVDVSFVNFCIDHKEYNTRIYVGSSENLDVKVLDEVFASKIMGETYYLRIGLKENKKNEYLSCGRYLNCEKYLTVAVEGKGFWAAKKFPVPYNPYEDEFYGQKELVVKTIGSREEREEKRRDIDREKFQRNEEVLLTHSLKELEDIYSLVPENQKKYIRKIIEKKKKIIEDMGREEKEEERLKRRKGLIDQGVINY